MENEVYKIKVYEDLRDLIPTFTRNLQKDLVALEEKIEKKKNGPV